MSKNEATKGGRVMSGRLSAPSGKYGNVRFEVSRTGVVRMKSISLKTDDDVRRQVEVAKNFPMRRLAPAK